MVTSSTPFTVEATVNFPSTAASYNGLFLTSATDTIWVCLHWESQNHYDVIFNGSTVYTGAVAGGSNTKLKLVITTTDWKAYINDSLVYTGGNTFANKAIDFGFNKYKETTGYLRSGYYDDGVKRTLGEYIGAGPVVTKGLYHLNGNSVDESG